MENVVAHVLCVPEGAGESLAVCNQGELQKFKVMLGFPAKVEKKPGTPDPEKEDEEKDDNEKKEE
jgi:hypothetical protein